MGIGVTDFTVCIIKCTVAVTFHLSDNTDVLGRSPEVCVNKVLLYTTYRLELA